MHRAWASSLPLSWNSASTACTPHQQRILFAPNEINKGVFSAVMGACAWGVRLENEMSPRSLQA